MAADGAGRQQERATYLSLMGLFLALLGIVGWRDRSQHSLKLTTLDTILLILAAFRGGRLVAWDHVAEPVRAPFTETVPDSSGAGDNVQAAGQGARRAIGNLLSCPICSGTWVAAFLVYGLRLLPGPTRLLVAILGATGGAELLNEAAEALTWHAARQRQETGKLMRR